MEKKPAGGENPGAGKVDVRLTRALGRAATAHKAASEALEAAIEEGADEKAIHAHKQAVEACWGAFVAAFLRARVK